MFNYTSENVYLAKTQQDALSVSATLTQNIGQRSNECDVCWSVFPHFLTFVHQTISRNNTQTRSNRTVLLWV